MILIDDFQLPFVYLEAIYIYFHAKGILHFFQWANN